MRRLAALAPLMLVMAVTAPAQSGRLARAGDTVRPTPLRGIVLNDEGHRSLADYRGRPVLVEWWGTR